jgi:uncharacterized protein
MAKPASAPGDGVALIDHHVHGIFAGELDAAGIEAGLMESTSPPPPGTSAFDTQLGFAVRRWCAPLLDLAPLAPADEYVRRRLELGSEAVARRFLSAAAAEMWLVDTGFQSDAVTTPGELASLSGTPAREVVRLESVAAQVIRGAGAESYRDALTAAVHAAAASAVGFKTIAAYRGGLDLDPARPAPAAVAAAAGRWLRAIEAESSARLEDRVLIRHGIWAALDTGLPLQFHAGFGDTDSRLARSDPALLHDLLLASQPTGTPIMLLHCYPYHRQAATMANLFPHV